MNVAGLVAVSAAALLSGVGGAREQIAFESTRTGDSDIWLTTPSGRQPTNLTNSPGTWESTPALSPDGRRIAFVRGRRNGNRLWIMDADGSRQRLLAPRSRSAFGPVWSPRGDRIAFARRRHGNWDIWLADLGGDVRRVTRHPAREIDVSWDPEGERLVFDRIDQRDSDLWVIPADGGEAEPLTRTPAVAELNPAWSPNGEEIAFDAFRDRRYDLFALDTRTARIRRLTRDRADDGSPAWSPDGRALVYDRGVGEDYEIATVDASDPGRPRNVTRAPGGLDLAPSWGPAPGAALAASAVVLQIDWTFSCSPSWPGTGVRDTYDGNDFGNFMCGAAANDLIRGNGGSDWIAGGEGRDELRGGDGTDYLKAREGTEDAVHGGNRDNDAAKLDAKDDADGVEREYR